MTPKQYLTNLNERGASAFLMLLLGGDLVLIALHVVNVLWIHPHNPLIRIDVDRGYAEAYQYIKYLWMAALLSSFSRAKREWRYLAWTAVFGYFLADDFLQLHERYGNLIATRLGFSPPFGLRPQDVGELLVSATAGTSLLVPLIIAYWSGSQVFKRASQDIAILISILVFFGVGVDMAHSAIDLGWRVDFVLIIVEDGGEMFAASLLAWYCFLLTVRSETSSYFLCEFLRTVLIRRK